MGDEGDTKTLSDVWHLLGKVEEKTTNIETGLADLRKNGLPQCLAESARIDALERRNADDDDDNSLSITRKRGLTAHGWGLLAATAIAIAIVAALGAEGIKTVVHSAITNALSVPAASASNSR